MQCGDFQIIYNPSLDKMEPWYVNDHCFIYGHDRKWHLFGITHAEPAAPLEEKHFLHITSETLLNSQWHKEPDIMHYNSTCGESHVWAPFVIEHDGLYYMYYCAGGKSHEQYRIHLATSPDLYAWTRHPDNPMLIDGFDARDPAIYRYRDTWVLYYTANSRPDYGNHVVKAKTSRNLVNWENERTVFTHPIRGAFGGPTESPIVIGLNDKHYLFITSNLPYNHSIVLESDDPFHWNLSQQIGGFPAHAAEVVKDLNGKWYISRAGWGQGGVHLAPLMGEMFNYNSKR